MRMRPLKRVHALFAGLAALFLITVSPAIASGTERTERADAQDGASTISLIQCENRLYVPARVNGVDAGLLVLDTGSSHTTISPDLARKLRLPSIGQKKL